MKLSEETAYFFPGEQIADFQLIRPLRVRELSECWYGFRLESGDPVAIKFLRKENPRIPQFRDVAAFLQRGESPFLIRVLESGETNQGMPFAVMEFAEAGSLRNVLRKEGSLSLPRAVRLLREMLLALDALHRNGIIHRDVKPDNIWRRKSGENLLGDLGLAKLPNHPEERGKVFGTAAYLSPEQARDSTAVDERSDLYSLAVVLFEALTGKRYRPKESFTDTVKRILSDRSAPSPEMLRDAATGKLALLLVRMLEYSPSLRPRSAFEVLAELDSMDLPEES